MAEKATEFMALDDIIKMNRPKMSGANSIAGSSKMSIASQSRRGGFKTRGGFKMGPGSIAARPKNIDWVWTKEGGSLAKSLPQKFYRGSGRGMRGTFGFRKPYFQKNPRFFVTLRGRGNPKYGNQLGRQYYRGGAWVQRRTLEQQLLPVHQRLGWMAPSLAQNVARNRVKVASWYLNKKQQYAYLHSNNTQYMDKNNYQLPNMLEQRLMRQQKQHMSAMSSNASNISISVVNELANARQFVVPRQPRGGGRQMQGVSRLSKQNVALLPNGGVFVHPNQSNRSQSQSYYSRNSYASRRSQLNQQHNRDRLAQRQLPSCSDAAPSLSSISRHLASGLQASPAVPVKHVVTLDLKLQAEIEAIQRKAAQNNGDSGTMCIGVEAFDYRPAAFATTTSISDRFSVIASV